MTRTMTADDVTPAVKSAVRAYLLTRAHAETHRERIDAMERDVLTGNGAEYYVADKWKERRGDRPERITEPKHAYLLDDDDFADYHAECQHRIQQLYSRDTLKAMGWKPDYCPALIAEHLQVQTEGLLIEAGAEMLGVDEPEQFNNRLLCCGLEKRKEFIDLLCRLVVNLPDFRNPLTGEKP